MGAQNIFDWPQVNQKQLFTMLVYLLSDSNQEVRINTRMAILSLEYGPNPLGSREDSEKLIKALVGNQFEQ